MKKLMSLLLVVLMAVALLPAAAFAASGATVTNLQVTDATYYSSGALKSLSAKFDWVQGGVTARLTLMTQRLQGTGDSGDWGDFSNYGSYGTAYNDFNEVLADNSNFGIIAYTNEMSIGSSSVNNSVSFSFAETAIPLSTNATYYVYLWSQYNGHCYPDNLMFVIQVKDGAVQYTPATPEAGRNVYNASAFEAVVSQTTFSVTVTAAENMTKTESSGAAAQTDLGVPMTPVVYTADRGYVFPEDYVSGITITADSGITVTRNSARQITVSGMPVKNTAVTLPAPAADTEYDVVCAANLTGGTVSADYSKAYAGDVVTITAEPETGYNFVAFSVKDASGADVAVTDGKFTMPASDVSVAAEFAKKEYSVTYMADGTQVGETQTVKHGEDAVPETVPAKEGYTGSWDADGKNITADTTITADYTINTYEVKYMTDGTQVGQTQTVKHGEDAVPETVPAKTGYTGSWDSDGTNITADTTITANYVINTYEVKYMAEGVQVGETQTVKHGEDAVPETVPAKEGYTGSWSSDGKNITADTTITADYTINTYEVKYMTDGTQVGQTQTVKHGEDAVPETVPAKEGYTGSWDADGKNITADTTITANYVINTYEVKYMAEGIQVGQTQIVEHGGNATAPEIPAKDGYMAQWGADGKNITADTTIEAVYTAIPVDAPAADIPRTGDERSVLLWAGMLLLTMGAAAMIFGKKKYNN